MAIEAGKRSRTTVHVNNQDRERADVLIDKGLADTFSEAVRVALALAVIAVERVGLSHSL